MNKLETVRVNMTYLLVLAASWLCLMSVDAYAFESRLNSFKAEYPGWLNTANNGTHGCVTCHTSNSGGGSNAYRIDFAANSFSFSNIENLDSDNDGVTNINEILVDFHPGWKSGDAGVNSLGVNISAFLTPQNDLSVTISAPTAVTVGENITYQQTISNSGPQDATAVMFTNTLPANVNFVSSTSTQGNCLLNGSMIDCSLGRINNGNSVTVTTVVTATTVGQQVSNVSVSAGQIEVNAGNNSASASTTVNQVIVPPPPGGVPNSDTAYLPAIISMLLSDDAIAIKSGVPVMDSVEFDEFKLYKINATGSTNNILVELTGLSNDIDLYVRLGEPPTRDTFDCRGFNSSTTPESCSVIIPSTPTAVYIGVTGFFTAGSYTLEATLRTLN